MAKAARLLSKPLEEDVFNVDIYGEEEFGPDDPNAKPKKARKKKKNTKAIFVFGDNAEVYRVTFLMMKYH